MIYDISKNILDLAYDVNGDSLTKAYDIDGVEIFPIDSLIVKTMEYNVGGWYTGNGGNVPAASKNSYEMLLRNTLSDDEAEIVGFQEYWNNFCADGTTAVSILDDYYTSNNAINGDTTYGGRGISANYPLMSSTTFEFSTHTSYQHPNLVDVFQINGHNVYVLSCHLDWDSQEMQETQVQELIEYLSDKEYFIVFGDFNASITTSENRTSAEYIGVCKPFIDAGYNMANWKSSFLATYYNGSSASASSSILCTDNIITSANIGVYNPHVDTRKLTDGLGDVIDHIPLIATLTIPT